ncbi:DoxX family membrane protein [Amorphoplanes digitatis]|uniref:Thiosulfate dehydrogenase [quinone] large subunit n=1 Tax=Actinoplanes digitatis TaxID=1868 RepID=A0A7W7MRY1_9ACTN|nr:DoxX family membrane protein [Actinoplanes digitatis]MBB4764182.1 thiosulfate dehydrogenase [quinone] large subunit [Actinoplanes digitatis]GID97571.1 membrane protein [Actinoplanes digitatis]
MTTTSRHAAHLEQVEAPGHMLTRAAARALAVLRISVGFVFLWAFLDKMFGFGYATPTERAWINGGSPTKGFLSSVDVGPLQGFYHNIAGQTWADWGFMLGMLAMGLALVLGIGLRIAACAVTVMMAMMWAAEWPLAQQNAAGEPSGSSNPIVDYHVVYALSAIVVALTYAGHTWGLGRQWVKLPFVQKHRWLI